MYDHNSARAVLEEFHAGKINKSKLYSTIHLFGQADLIEARPDVERFLTNERPDLRSIALHVLTLHFKLQEHWQTAVDFLLYDPDISCRSKGASALEWLKRNTRDSRTLSILASVATNKNEEIGVRGDAYTAMRGIFSYDNEEQLHIIDHNFNLERDADWEFVRTCLNPHLEDEWREEAQKTLGRYISGKVPKQEYYGMLIKFGLGKLQEARQVVEVFLHSDDLLLRQAALRVLVLDLQTSNSQQLALDGFLHDSDIRYRQTAVEALGQSMRTTRDKATLQLLNQFFFDEKVSMDVIIAMETIYGGPYGEVEKFLATPD